MTTEPATLQATFAQKGYVKGRGQIVLSFELENSEYNDALVQQVLGAPVQDKSKWVTIVRMAGDERPALLAKKQQENHSADASEMVKPKGPHSDYAQKLYQSYFMRSEAVCRALGTEADYKAWIQKQDSCVSGKQDYIGMEFGEMRCEESHVERVAAGHGKGIKAPYHSVPLTHAEHKLRHQKGELECLLHNDKRFRHNYEAAPHPRAAALWFEMQAIEYREKWVHERLCARACVKSLTDIHPKWFMAWAKENGVEEALPK